MPIARRLQTGSTEALGDLPDAVQTGSHFPKVVFFVFHITQHRHHLRLNTPLCESDLRLAACYIAFTGLHIFASSTCFLSFHLLIRASAAAIPPCRTDLHSSAGLPQSHSVAHASPFPPCRGLLINNSLGRSHPTGRARAPHPSRARRAPA